MKDKDKTAIDFAVALKTYCREHAGCDERGCQFFFYDNEGSVSCVLGWNENGDPVPPSDWRV